MEKRQVDHALQDVGELQFLSLAQGLASDRQHPCLLRPEVHPTNQFAYQLSQDFGGELIPWRRCVFGTMVWLHISNISTVILRNADKYL